MAGTPEAPAMQQRQPFATSLLVVLGLVFSTTARSAEKYDLLLRGGHVIDPRSKLSAVCDVALRDGKIAAVAAKIDASATLKTVDVTGLYVTPGLIDLHVHVFAGTGERSFIAG